jgi:chromate transport protein ChrA
LGAGLTVMWTSAIILSHIVVLGYGWFFIDALMLMSVAVIYLLLTRKQFHWSEHENVEAIAAAQTHKQQSGDQLEAKAVGLESICRKNQSSV